MNDKQNKIFSAGGCLTYEMFHGYLNETLSNKEKHIVEKHLVDCGMCSDALEGLSFVTRREGISAAITRINDRIRSKTKRKEQKIIRLNTPMKVAVAAGIVLLVGITFLLNNPLEKQSEKIFADQFEPYPVKTKKENTPAATDSQLTKEYHENKEKQQEISFPSTADASKKAAEKKPTANQQLDESTLSGELNLTAAEPQPTAVRDDEDGTKMKEGKSVAPQGTANTTTSGGYHAIYSSPPSPQKKLGADIPKTKSEEEKSIDKKATMTDKEEVPAEISFETREKTKDERLDNVNENQLERKKIKADEGDSEREEKDLAKKSKTRYRSKGYAKAKRANTQPDFGGAGKSPTQPASTGKKSVASPDTARVITLSATSAVIENKQASCMKKYESKDYNGAILCFEEILQSDPANPTALFYSAVSYLGVTPSGPDKAIANLDKVLQTKSKEYYEAAEWYKALALLKKNEKDNAQKLLRQISESKSPYNRKAAETLDELAK